MRVSRQLGDGRRATDSARELALGLLDLEHALLKAARQVDGPASVAEVTLDLAHHGRYRVRGERHPAAGLEPVYGLHEAETRDLQQVLEGLASAQVAPGHLMRERKGPLDQLVANGFVAARAQTPESLELFGMAARARSSYVSHGEHRSFAFGLVAMVRVAANPVRSASNVPS